MLNAQMSTEVVYVKNGIVKSFYEVYDNQLQGGGITYRHIGRTISLNRKTYPFYVNLEDNASIRRFIKVLLLSEEKRLVDKGRYQDESD